MNASQLRLCKFLALLLAAVWSCADSRPVVGQTVAPSTWAHLTIDPQPRDAGGVPTGSPSAAAFDEWSSIPLALTDPQDNPSALNLIDIKDVKIANDSNFIYIYASGWRGRTKGLYLAFDTDQNVNTGFNIYGLGLVGSELGYVSDFPFDQRTPGVFNSNSNNGTGSCCTGGPLDVDNGGAALYPGWDVEYDQREWGVPLDAVWSVNQPFGPTIPNKTFNLMLWTDQGLTDVTDVITYTLATPPVIAGDYNGNGIVDAADYTVWRDTLGSHADLRANGDNSGASAGVIDQADYTFWKSHFGSTGPGAGAAAAVPEPTTLGSAVVAAVFAGIFRRTIRRRPQEAA